MSPRQSIGLIKNRNKKSITFKNHAEEREEVRKR